jgi:lysophospholipase L1-like esterase
MSDALPRGLFLSYEKRLLAASLIFFLALIGGLVLNSVMVLSGYKSSFRHRFRDPATQFDAQLGWAPVPNFQSYVRGMGLVTTNSFGFRSPEIVGGRDKILVLGDSVAWGYGVGDDDDFSSLLQSALGPRSPDVVNMAVSGYGPDQEYGWLARNINGLGAGRIKRIILVICSSNDLEDIVYPFAEGRLKPLYRLRAGKVISPPLLRSKYCLTNLICASPIRGLWRSKLLLWLNESAEGRESEQLTEEFWKRINDLAEKAGARFTIVLAPSQYDLHEESARYKWFKTALIGRHYEFLDFKSALARQGNPEAFFIEDGIHFSRSGNDLLAREVVKLIQPSRSAIPNSARSTQ